MTQKELTSHKSGGMNNDIQVQASRPGAGGACTRYDVFGPRNDVRGVGSVPSFGLNIRFQDGPPANGINGLTNEVLLAIVEDRLAGFQDGPFKCIENRLALGCVRSAIEVLKCRTVGRTERGVEGTHTV